MKYKVIPWLDEKLPLPRLVYNAVGVPIASGEYRGQHSVIGATTPGGPAGGTVFFQTRKQCSSSPDLIVETYSPSTGAQTFARRRGDDV